MPYTPPSRTAVDFALTATTPSRTADFEFSQATVVSGAGSSAGSAACTATAVCFDEAVGASSGVGVASATSLAVIASVGASAGTATASAVGSEGASIDPYFDNVVLGLHMDGADNGTTFTDITGKTVTRTGNTVTKTAVKRFGTASAFFDGTGDNLTIANSSAIFDMTGSVTFECWFNISSFANTPILFCTNGAGGTNAGNYCHITSAGAVRFVLARASSPATTTAIASANGVVTTNTWTHVAFVKSGTTGGQIFVNGVSVVSSSFAENAATGNSGRATQIGSYYDAANSVNGYLDDVRFTTLARYTDNFAPPIAPFPDTGANYQSGAGASAGAATSTGTSAAIVTAAGTSVATATAAATATAFVLASASASGLAAGTATGRGVFSVLGTATGSATANAPNVAFNLVTGASAGVAAASATSAARATAAGASTATAAATAAATSTTQSVGASAGLAAASATSIAIKTAAASSAATATAAATATSFAQAVGTSSGTTTVSGASSGATTVSGAGASGGSASATATATAFSQATGASAGSATATSAGGALRDGVGGSAATSTSAATGAALASVAAASSGSATAAAASLSYATAAGSSDGVATAAATSSVSYPPRTGTGANTVEVTSQGFGSAKVLTAEELRRAVIVTAPDTTIYGQHIVLQACATTITQHVFTTTSGTDVFATQPTKEIVCPPL